MVFNLLVLRSGVITTLANHQRGLVPITIRATSGATASQAMPGAAAR
jgi:hypothetical protein